MKAIRMPWAAVAAVESQRAPGQSPVEDEVVALYDQLRVPVMRYLLANRVPVADAEEIVQEIFLLLFRKLQKEKLGVNTAGWVFGAAHNFWLKHREKARREAGLVDGWEPGSERVADPTARADSMVLSAERQQTLMAVVRALPEPQQQCLQLRAEGLRYREIAKILGMSLGSVANALQSALARLERADR
jgi:RNA polymerase sigma-70 factor (ECF subfamily)